MRIFKKNGRNKNTMVLQGEVGTAVRAQYNDGGLPNIEMKFKVRHGYHKGEKKEFDEVTVEMNALEANEFARYLLAALEASLPRVARGAQHTRYGE